MPINPFSLNEIWRFPVKGFPGHKLETISVNADQLIPLDRQYAVSNGHPATKAKLGDNWLPKRHFLQLLCEERLASLSFECDDVSQTITLRQGTEIIAAAPMSDSAAITQALYERLPGRFPEKPDLCTLKQGGYTDNSAPWISIGGTASLDDFARLSDTAPDNRRFRLNLIIQTNKPFEELDWVGRKARIGEVEIIFTQGVTRCGAIRVNPDKAVKEDDYLAMMQQEYGHTKLGVFARITKGGQLAPDMVVSLL